MMKDMYDYLLETGPELYGLIRNEMDLLSSFDGLFAGKCLKKIYLAGSGSSYHAALAGRRFFEKYLGVETEAIHAMEFADKEMVCSDSILIGISQGGHSESTLEAIKRAQDEGITVAGITQDLHSPIAEAAKCCIPLFISEENVGPKTKGFYAEVCTLDLLALRWAVNSGKTTAETAAGCREEMAQLVMQIPEIALAAKEWYMSGKKIFRNVDRIVVIGDDHVDGSVAEGALKLLEGIRCSVTGYELEEFMHGIYHSINENTLVIGLGYPDRHYERLCRLLNYLHRSKKAVIVITGKEKREWQSFCWKYRSSPELSVFEYLVLLQVLARTISLDRGIDCCVNADPDFHRMMESYRY